MKCKGLVLALSLVVGSAAQAQILTNGSFESGATGWTFNNGTSVISPATAFSNQDGANVALLNSGGLSGLLQTFTLTPNTNYIFSAYVAGAPTGDDAFIRFLLSNSTFNSTINQSQFLVGATPVGGAMTQISIAFNSGAIANAGLQVDSFTAGGASPRNLFLDRVGITLAGGASAPEPTALSLLALGALPLALRRRRA